MHHITKGPFQVAVKCGRNTGVGKDTRSFYRRLPTGRPGEGALTYENLGFLQRTSEMTHPRPSHRLHFVAFLELQARHLPSLISTVSVATG